MTGSWKRYRDIALVVLLLAVPFFVLRANTKRREQQSTLDRVVLRIVAPVESAVAVVIRGVTGLFHSYVYLVDVKADADRLAYENARLKETVHKLEQYQGENRELRRLLQLRETLPGETVSAHVVGKDFTEFFRVTRLVLDRGSRDVRAHQPVVAPEGVVGSILRVNGDTVDVQLAVDAAFGVDVEDARTRARGFVRGTGNPSKYLCKVEMVGADDEVEVNDLLVTSGKGRWFPKGIPVARVTQVIKRELGREQEVIAVPTVDFSRLDAVLVLTTPESEEPQAAAQDGSRTARGRTP